MKTVFIAATALLLGAGVAGAQVTVNMTAAATTAAMPDGTLVPMWGYTCGTVTGAGASCNPANKSGGWSPVIITVPAGQSLNVNLTNNLPAGIPTSLVIVGQLGGGLGTSATSTPSPNHDNQGTTWPVASSGAVFTPPTQSARVRSFSTEVGNGQTLLLPAWSSPRAGTYLMESGTHPSIQATMGLIGMVVVTTAPNGSTPGTAYPAAGAIPAANYNADVPLIFSEIDPVQNNAVNTAVNSVGFSESATRGLYLGGPVASLSLTGGGSGYTSAPALTFAAGSPTATGHAVIDTDSTSATFGQVIEIDIDSAGNYAVAPTVTFTGGGGAGATAVAALPLKPNGVAQCSGGALACYPPVVNYSPLYYLINGVAFDKTNAGASLFATSPATGVTGTVLVRMVNAGSRMHVPAIVGSQIGTVGGFSLIAEDGNPLPGTPRVQNEVFMAAGKTYDVMVKAPSGGSALPVYDRELSLSGNATSRDAGMLAYIGVNGGALPANAGLASATAKADFYNSIIAGHTLTVSDPSKGVIANDINVYGVKVVAPPTQGTLALNTDGTFTYVASATWATADHFGYCGNGMSSGTACATVTLGPAPPEAATGINMKNITYTSKVATYLKIAPSGVLSVDSDTNKYPLSVASSTVLGTTSGFLATGVATTATAIGPCSAGVTTSCVAVDKSGGFNAYVPAAGTYAFTYQAQNSQGTLSASSATVTLIFPTPSNLHVKVLDGADKTTLITDYRWIIEEDRTFYVDPNCTKNPLPAGCPTVTPSGAPAVFGTNFHTSHMPIVAAGCTGALSCEDGQTVLGLAVVCDQGNGACRPGTGLTRVPTEQVQLDPTKRYYISIFPGDAAQPFIAGYVGAPAGCATTAATKGGSAATDSGTCGHGMGGAPVVPPCAVGDTACTASFADVTVLTQPSPYPPATLSVFVFEDDYPLNGEHDAGGGIDVLSPNEPGLGGFQITLQDNAGGTGDSTGTPTYDMFNMPLSNKLAGTVDPATGFDACPIGPGSRGLVKNPAYNGTDGKTPGTNGQPAMIPDPTSIGITGMIITCPKYEADGVTLSPLAGQASVANLYPGRYGVVANPGADRIGRGEEWLQTNTLDGQKGHDSFMRIGEPGYFQEFGPGGYHVTIGFANPKVINDRKAGMCPTGTPCSNEVKGHVTTARMSRTPDERLYGSGNHAAYAFTQCYASLGDPDGADFAFVKCDGDGNFDFTGIPDGNLKLTLFDQWNDQVVDGISTPVGLSGTSVLASSVSGGSGYTTAPVVTVSAPPCTINTTTCIRAVAVATVSNGAVTAISFTNPGVGYTTPPTITIAPPPAGTGHTTATASAGFGLDLGEVAVHQWQADFFTRSFLDLNGDGVSQPDTEPGLALVKTNVRFRDGSFSNRNNTDLNGYAAFNEEFPLFNWYVIETDNTRYKNTGTHIVYDAGGPTDGTTGGGTSTIAANLANTIETIPLPTNLRVPGAVYCNTADCTGLSIAAGPAGTGGPTSSGPGGSTGRIDPPWVETEGWQGYSGQNNFLEFGKKPYAAGENGGITGHVIYSSTRPFDDPQFNTQNVWEPLVPGVTINLYQEGTAPDGSQSLTLVDTTKTSSFDEWAQGFRSDNVPNMNCPGQSTTDPFFFGLQDQPNYLDWYNSQHTGTAVTALPAHSQFKCYDGMHNWNQLQPAPYDGMYKFPSVTGLDPTTGKPTGTNCTGCTTNPDATDPYRFGAPMLPAGKYVVEVVPPQGYEVVKEEDKNILIGDNFIAPVTAEFGGLGNIFIIPDQAQVAASYNSNSAQNATNSMGRVQTLESHEGDTPTVDTFWPCVGETRIVPDYISLFPTSTQVAPFAGATRNLCDRKEVTLDDQTSLQAEFFLWTQTHISSKFTGVITDDFDAEFDPFSPQFGEKFAPAYLPVAVKDWAGNETQRVYTDEWGIYNGLSYSTWEVNPPNPTGYAPTMMVMCMNDPGTGKTPDPMFQSGYSNFCYELPFMPGATGYFDTPVVPTSAFGGGYNHPDCAYPDLTPAVSEVDGDGIGPWVSAPGHTLTITGLGDQSVENTAYSGPGVKKSPYDREKITRHYGFGATQGTGTVKIGGVIAPVTHWDDQTIAVTVPTLPVTLNCGINQQTQYGGSPAQCGQLVITADNGKQSVDAVTVTVGGKTPTVLAANTTIQSAIDAAQPGDLIMVPKGKYSEMLIMWKPVRLQGVGAASTVIDANPHPAGRLDPWRRQIVCLFGLALNGTPISSTNVYDPNYNAAAGTGFNCSDDMKFSVDRLPLEATVGWTATLNGNLAEMLIEPSLMGAYEGAGITVLAKGVKFPDSSHAFDSDVFPTGTDFLRSTDCNTGTGGSNPYPSNFWCNPSRIDGLSVTNSSQGGGGIMVHAWGHNIEIANNRVYGNQGTLSGGITVGQGEHPDLSLAGVVPTTIPGSCESDLLGTLDPSTQTLNEGLPFCFDMNVNIHNNAVTLNSSLGDELFSSTPAGAGGVTMCNGSDYYNFDYNWVCGNMSTGDGAGFAHIGFTKNGSIEHNSILFNQSTNPSITTNGGGLLVMGAPDQDPPCALTNDNDCLSPAATITPSDGTGPGLIINANLIMGNSADAGSGGGLRLQHINGNDVLNFPSGLTACPVPGTQVPFGTKNTSCLWNSVSVTNNIITNNVAGWDGAGVSLIDALAVNIINNTIASNDTTAIAGPLYGSLFSQLASTPGVNCTTNGGTFACPQPAGLVAETDSPVLVANIGLLTLPRGTRFNCPPGHGTGGTGGGGGGGRGSCSTYSVPLLANNLIWQNRSFVPGLGAIGAGGGDTTQQRLVSLYNGIPAGGGGGGGGAHTLASSQTSTGACPITPAAPSYWDIGVRGDTGPGNHAGGRTLAPLYTVLTSTAGYGGGNNSQLNPSLESKYCDGSRVPPELGSFGYNLTPGTNETNALPTPIFSLTTSATVDEGNNWVNLRWGPLTMFNPVTGAGLADYSLADNSPVIGMVPAGEVLPGGAVMPAFDFFGNPRPASSSPGAVQYVVTAPKLYSISPNPVYTGTTATVTLVGSKLLGVTAVTITPNPGPAITVGTITVVNSTTVTAIFTIPAGAALGTRSVTVTNPDGTSNAVTFTVALPPLATLTSIVPNSGIQGTVVPVTLTGTGFVDGLSTVAITGTGVTVSAVTVVGPTTITATFTIAATAVPGADNVTVVNGSQISAPLPFTVLAPTITSIVPNTGLRGTTVAVTLTGTNLTAGSTLTVTPPPPGGGATAIAVSNVVITPVIPGSSPAQSQITATFTIPVGATLGLHTVTVTNSGGATATVAFTVVTPTITAINPSSGVRGTTVPVTLTGTGFLAGTTVAITNPGGGGGGNNVTVGAVTVSPDGTTLTTTFIIPVGAALTARNVTVTNVAGTSNAVTFTVVGPSLTSITPNTGTLGSTVPVTLSGAYLTTATGITVSGNGGGGGGGGGNAVTCTITGITGTAAATNVAANCAIPAGAAATVRNIAVVTTIGTTNTVPFTVSVPAVPTLTLIAPVSGLVGTTVNPVTLTGTNFTSTGTTVAITNPGGGGGGGGNNVTVGAVTVSPDGKTITTSFTIPLGAPATARTVTVTTPGGTTAGVTFTVQGPTLTSITPATGTLGSTVAVNLAGTNLLGATAITVSGNGGGGGGNAVTCTITGITATNVAANCVIPAGAAVSARNIAVVTPIGTTNNVTFTVNVPALPTLTSIAPVSGVQGTTVNPVTLTGSNFTATGTTVAITNPGGGGGGNNVTVGAVTVSPDGTTITTSFTIPAGAPATARTVTVTTPGGTTGTVAFTVTVPAPTLTSIAPITGVRGTAVAVTLTGTNLTGATAVNVPAGITVGALTVTPTTVTTTLTLTAAATLGTNNVSVTTPGGTTGTVVFTVTAPAPTLASIAPNTGLRGTAVPVTLTGTGLTGATVVNVPAGITVGALTVTPTTVATTFTLTAAANPGANNVSVTTPGGTTATVPFTVTVPTLASIAPATGGQGAVVSVTLTGTGLTGATAVNVPTGSGITVGALTVTPTSVATTFTLAAAATLGANNVSVTTPGGTTGTVAFTVTVPAPTLASVAPTSGVRGTTVPVTLTGTNLTGATAVTFSAGASCTGIVVNTTNPLANTVTANCTIAAAATTGPGTVTVTTPIGTTNTEAFTVQGPTLTGGATGVIGTTASATFTGTNLTGATAVAISGGITCTGVTSTATSVTASCTVPAGTALGASNVTVTTPIGNATLTGGFQVTGATAGFTPTTFTLSTTPGTTITKTGFITVTNTATGVTAGPLTMTAAPTAGFTGTPTGRGPISVVAGGGTCASGTVLNPGASCTIEVQYGSSAPGPSNIPTPIRTAAVQVTITGTGLFVVGAPPNTATFGFTAN